jgi:non-specific serine/threonine protein kinase
MTSSPDAVGSVNTAPFRCGELEKSFAICQAAGIMAIAGGKSAPDWPLSWMFWRDFGTRYLLQLCQTQTTSERIEPLSLPDASMLAHLTLSIPPMPGAEYCTPDVLGAIWSDLDAWALESIAGHQEGLAGFLRRYAPLWRPPTRC